MSSSGKTLAKKPNPVYLKIGTVIRTRRKALGMVQKPFSKKIRLAQAQLSRLENGQQGMRFDVLLRISKALNAAPSEILVEAGL